MDLTTLSELYQRIDQMRRAPLEPPEFERGGTAQAHSDDAFEQRTGNDRSEPLCDGHARPGGDYRI